MTMRCIAVIILFNIRCCIRGISRFVSGATSSRAVPASERCTSTMGGSVDQGIRCSRWRASIHPALQKKLCRLPRSTHCPGAKNVATLEPPG
ncbi:hypothetical protein B0T09DRAFT_338129 [Sordaria sp. MPI-SDFR-AT-0083]|nr:hypothetical protein B0T09DRAFT_338129 [Sordaria sp. MPI-SDFR-AT-0083]